MAMLLIKNASGNVQFLFFYITWTKFKVSFQSQNSHHRASQISIRFRNPKSILHFNIPSLQHLPFSTRGYFFLLSNNILNFPQIKCLVYRLYSLRKKTVKEEYVIVTIIFTSLKNQIKTISKKSSYMFPFRKYKNIAKVYTFLEMDLFTVSSFSLKKFQLCGSSINH